MLNLKIADINAPLQPLARIQANSNLSPHVKFPSKRMELMMREP